MNDNMMKNEVKYLREHLREIYQYKSSMADLTYDMSLELLSRCCIAFDYLQQELQRKDNIIKIMENYLELIYDLGYDHDGCETTSDLMSLIDEIVRYASLGRVYNTTETIYVNGNDKYNILHEKIEVKNE